MVIHETIHVNQMSSKKELHEANANKTKTKEEHLEEHVEKRIEKRIDAEADSLSDEDMSNYLAKLKAKNAAKAQSKDKRFKRVQKDLEEENKDAEAVDTNDRENFAGIDDVLYATLIGGTIAAAHKSLYESNKSYKELVDKGVIAVKDKSIEIKEGAIKAYKLSKEAAFVYGKLLSKVLKKKNKKEANITKKTDIYEEDPYQESYTGDSEAGKTKIYDNPKHDVEGNGTLVHNPDELPESITGQLGLPR